MLHAGLLWLWGAGAVVRHAALTSRCGGFSVTVEHRLWARGLQYLQLTGSRALAQLLCCMGLVALRHVGSSPNRYRDSVPCIARCILNYWAIKEAQHVFLNV